MCAFFLEQRFGDGFGGNVWRKGVLFLEHRFVDGLEGTLPTPQKFL